MLHFEREDLMIEVERLAKEEKFDYLLIESTGMSEPVPVAQTFSFVDEENGIVIIEIKLDKEKISKELNHCLLTDQELNSINWKEGFEDNWAVERSFPLD